MSNVKLSQNDKYTYFAGIQQFGTNSYGHMNSSFIKQRIHERKIDEFFHTDIEAPKKRTSILAMIGSAVGVLVPILAIAKKQHPELKLNSFKGLKKFIDIEYDVKELIAVGLGGVLGGLAGGLADRKEPNKLDKIEEATFQTMNVSIPAILVGVLTKSCAKVKSLNNGVAKIGATALGIFSGVNSAVIIANKIDGKLFDKYNKDKERKFQKKDFIVHVDDIFGSLVLAKFPIADKLHVEKILPLIYAWTGYQVGEK